MRAALTALGAGAFILAAAATSQTANAMAFVQRIDTGNTVVLAHSCERWGTRCVRTRVVNGRRICVTVKRVCLKPHIH